MDVRLLYFDGCPNWRETEDRLRTAMQLVGLDSDQLVLRQVPTARDAEQEQFHGSPTVRLDGVDVFAVPDAPVGLSCRLFATPEGLQGAPLLEQLVQVLQRSPQH